MCAQSDSELISAYDFFKFGDPASAKKVLENALSDNLENKDIMFALRCANFWIARLKESDAISDLFKQGEYLISSWKRFSIDIRDAENKTEQPLYAIKKGIFQHALNCFNGVLGNSPQSQKAIVFSRIGLTQKMLGNYENALSFLMDANDAMQNSADVLANMADCYALCGDDRTAKVLFREAFFINAQLIDIALLESELIIGLKNKISGKGYEESILKEWLPVYGVLYGVLNLHRELRTAEVFELKQDIYSLENELKGTASDPNLLIPRLINHYFWLVDYYNTVHDDRAKINEIMLKIKLLDADIYEKYVK